MSERLRNRAIIAAAESAILLDSAPAIAEASPRWHDKAVLGLDTEFVRERTYYARLGLVQISDGSTVWLVDPLVDGAATALSGLLRDRRITKIFHSPSEDLEILNHAVGALPDPLIDTQCACALLGQHLQMGFHKAVEWLLGFPIDKEHTRSNWCARPLRPAQLRYAALDVAPLPEMWSMLEQRLRESGRLDWFQEDCERQLRKAAQETAQDDLWQRIRGAGQLDGASLAILRELAVWREQEAKQRDRPRGFIVPDEILLKVASEKITRPVELEEIEKLHPRARDRFGQALCERVRKAMDGGRSMEPLSPLTGAQRRRVSAMRSIVQERAKRLGLEPGVLATKAEMEALARGQQPPERLTGWRKPEITEYLLDAAAPS